MARLDISLPEDLRDWAAAPARDAQFADASEYLAELLRRDRREAEQLARLHAAIDEGLASPIVDTTIDEIITRAKARHGIA